MRLARFLTIAIVLVSSIGSCLIGHVMGWGYAPIVFIWVVGTLGGVSYSIRIFGNGFKQIILAKKGKKATATITKVDINRKVNINDNWSPAKLYFTFKYNNKKYTTRIKQLVSHIGSVPFKQGQQHAIIFDPNKPQRALLADDMNTQRKAPVGYNIVCSIVLLSIVFGVVKATPNALIPGFAKPKSYENIVYVPSSDSTGNIWSVDTFAIKSKVIRTIRVYNPEKGTNEKVFWLRKYDHHKTKYQIKPFNKNRVVVFDNFTDTNLYASVFNSQTFKKEYNLINKIERFPEFENGIYCIYNSEKDLIFVKNMLGNGYYYHLGLDTISEIISVFNLKAHSPNNFRIKQSKNGDEIWLQSIQTLSKNNFVKTSFKVNSLNTDPDIVYSMHYNSNNLNSPYGLKKEMKINTNTLMVKSQKLYENNNVVVLAYKKDIKPESELNLIAIKANGEQLWQLSDQRLLPYNFRIIQATHEIMVLGLYNSNYMGINTQTGEILWYCNSADFWTKHDKKIMLRNYL